MIPKSDHRLYVKFVCQACGHTFTRQLRKIYFHAPTLIQMVEKETVEESAPIIPDPIECGRCKAVNHAEITSYHLGLMRLNALMGGILIPSRPDDVIQVVTFSFEGEIMHPLQAIRKYQNELAIKPEHIPHRFQYARALRMVGRWDEAETQYRWILDKDPQQVEAWYGLAMLAYARHQKRVARQALKELVNHAQQSQVPGRTALKAEACEILTGERPFESLLVDLVQVEDPPPWEDDKRCKERRKRRK
jgi:tetratricopeptide (TPR) repeat protein